MYPNIKEDNVKRAFILVVYSYTRYYRIAYKVVSKDMLEASLVQLQFLYIYILNHLFMTSHYMGHTTKSLCDQSSQIGNASPPSPWTRQHRLMVVSSAMLL